MQEWLRAGREVGERGAADRGTEHVGCAVSIAFEWNG